MIVSNFPQGSEEWQIARAGVCTGSMFREARDRLKPAKDALLGKFSQKSINYAASCAVERIAGRPVEMMFVTWQMKAGSAEEPAARIAYEVETGEMVEEAGFITTDDRKFGCSVDGFVGGDGVLEIKTICSPIKMVLLHRDRDFSEYLDQCNGAMWLLGRKWVDLVIWCPALAPIGKQYLRHRIYRDEKVIDLLEADLLGFIEMVDEFEDTLRMEEVEPIAV